MRKNRDLQETPDTSASQNARRPMPRSVRLLCLAIVFICLILATRDARAGPWPREPGKAFVTLTHEQPEKGPGWSGLYGELGLTERFTLGLDGGRSERGEATLLLFLQGAMGRPGGTHQTSAALGLGLTDGENGLTMIGEIGAAYGRAFPTPLGGGWIAASAKLRGAPEAAAPVEIREGDTSLIFSPVTIASTGKIDLTLGVSPGKNTLLFSQLQLEQRDGGDLASRLSTSAVRRLSPGTQFEITLIAPVAGSSDPAARMGIWLNF